MRQAKYVLYKIRNIDLKRMFKTVKTISVKTNKKFVVILFDVIFCGIKYQAGYHDYLQFEFYNLNAAQRKTYITGGINNKIVKKFNDKKEWYKLENKAVFHQLFKKFTKRDCLVIDNNLKEFEIFLKRHKVIIAKPIDGIGGKGILKITYNSKTNINELYDKLIKNDQLLIEECVVQHDKLSELYKQSVNTMRIYTFIENGNAHFLQAVLKIGNDGIVDNFASGGMYTVLSEKGKVIYNAIDKDDNIIEFHPKTNKKIKGFQVPMFDEAVSLVCDAAKIVPKIGYVGWDVAISKEGPLIIEGNCYPSAFQIKPSLNPEKIGALPKYNELMKIK